MTQLIINGLTLPETSHDKYQCYPEELGEQIEMISGRIVEEVRGTVQVIRWEYDYMPDSAALRQLLKMLRSGGALTVSYLPDDGDDLVTSSFLCIEKPYPTFAFARYGKPRWHNLAFTLREVRPHD